MPAPTIIEFRGEAKDLLQKLNSIKDNLGIVKAIANTDTDIDINVEDAVRDANILFTRLDRLEKEFRNLGNVKLNPKLAEQIGNEVVKVKGGFETVRGEYLRLQNKANTAYKDIADNAEKSSARVSKANTDSSLSFGKLVGSVSSINNILRATIFSRIVQEIYQAGKTSVKTSVELEALHNSFSAVLGGAAEANNALIDIRETADTLGVNFFDVSKNFLRMAAAGEAAGFQASEVKSIFDAVTVSATAMNLTAEQTSHTFAAFEQIMSKGVLSAEEIRRQLGNALPGAFALTARALGVTQAQLEKMFRSGQVLSNEALPKIAAEMVRTFGPAAIANVTSSRAEFERFGNKIIDLQKAIGDGLKPAILDLVHSFNEQTTNTQLVKVETEGVVNLFRDLIGLVGNLVTFDGAAWFANLGSAVTETAGYLGRATTGVAQFLNEILTLGHAGDTLPKQSLKIQEGVNAIVEELREWAGTSRSASDIAVDYNEKARKKIKELEEQLKKLSDQQRVNSLIGQDLAKNLPPAFEGAAKSINELAQSVQKYFDEIKAGNVKLDPQVVQFYAEEIARLRSELDKSGKLTPAFAAALDTLARALGNGTLAASHLSSALQELGIKTERQLQSAGKSVEDYAEAISKAGPITTEQADIITKRIKDISDDLKALPADQQKANQGLIDNLDKLGKKYEGFTTEAIKQGKKFKEETTKAFQETAKALGDIFDDLRDKMTGDASNDAANDLKSLQDELQALKDKTSLTTEEFNRYNELISLIPEKQKDVAGAIKAAFTETSKSVAESFREMILNNDNLIKGLALLPESSRAAFVNLVEGFNQTAEAGLATETTLTDLGTHIAEIFTQAGIPLQGFITSLKETATLSQQITAQIADLQKGKDSDLLGQTNKGDTTGTTAAADATANLGKQWHFTSEELKAYVEQQIKNNEIWVESRKGISELINEQNGYSFATEDLSEVIDILTGRAAKQNDALDKTGVVAGKVRDQFDLLNQDLTEGATNMDNVNNSLDEAVESADRVQFSFEEVTKTQREQVAQYKSQTAAIEGLRERQDSFNDSLVDTSATTNQVTTAIDKTGKAIESTADKTEKGANTMEKSLDGVKTAAEAADKIFELWETKRFPHMKTQLQEIVALIDATEAAV